MTEPIILAIDTSCDETCAAVSQGQRILANVIASQINIHQKYGGVVPHLAKRAHQAKIEYVVQEARKRAKQAKPDAVAVTIGPGLAPALEVGLAFGKNLAKKLKKPLIAVNHMEGHLLSALAKPQKKVSSAEPQFPAIGLLVSGGHTQLVLVKAIGQYRLLGETVDDAAGEALDKLAKMLKLGYPGGPIIEELAKKGNPETIPLPVPLQHSPDLNLSFSGLKTAAMYLIKEQKSLTKQFTYNLCAAFQQAIAKSLLKKLSKAIETYPPQTIFLGGGVFSNHYLRQQIRKNTNLPIYLPYSSKLYTDNAAMIAVAAYFKYLKKEFVSHPDKVDRQPNLNFQSLE